MNTQTIIPASNWITPARSGAPNAMAGGNNRSLLVFGSGNSTTHADPTRVVPAGENRLVVSCDAFRMYCVDLITGDILWTIDEHTGAEPRSDFRQTVYHNGVIYCGVNTLSFSAIDPATGKYLWKANCGKKQGQFCVPFVFSGNRAFASNEDTVFCFDLDKHKLLWKTKIEDKKTIYEHTPFLWNNYIVYPAETYAKKITPESYQFLYLNVETGEIERKVNLESRPSRFNSVFTGRELWYAYSDKDCYTRLACYDPESGEETPFIPDYPPLKEVSEWMYTINGNSIFGHNGKIYAYFQFKIGKARERGFYSCDPAMQAFEPVMRSEQTEGLVLGNWLQKGDFLYGYDSIQTGRVYRLSLVTCEVEKFESGFTLPMLKQSEWGHFKGACVDGGIIYLANRFVFDRGKDEDGRICLTAIW